MHMDWLFNNSTTGTQRSMIAVISGQTMRMSHTFISPLLTIWRHSGNSLDASVWRFNQADVRDSYCVHRTSQQGSATVTQAPQPTVAPPATSCGSVTPPLPTQSGIPCSCNKFAPQQDGAYFQHKMILRELNNASNRTYRQILLRPGARCRHHSRSILPVQSCCWGQLSELLGWLWLLRVSSPNMLVFFLILIASSGVSS